jgi:hypothetical protein
LIAVALVAGMVGCAESALSPQYDLTVSSTAGGSTIPVEGIHAYDEGTVVNLVATASAGYHFVNWTGDVGTIADVEDATTTITMNDHYSITANFMAQYILTIYSTDGGEVTTPGKGSFTYDPGMVVDLVAEAGEGYAFVNWTGDVSAIANVNAASTTITMNRGHSITANFVKGIWNWHDLDAIRDNMDRSYLLINDLDSTSAGYEELASPTANGGKGWDPIGSLVVDPLHEWIVDPVDAFTGSLDGQGYEIRDLFISRPDEDGVGLFSCAGEGHTIENLGVVNAEVTGRDYVGGLVGENRQGRVSDCYSTGSVTGDRRVGGLAGGNRWDRAYVSNSYSTASVTGTDNVGGLVGGNEGTVSDSYSIGGVTSTSGVGGLVGGNWRSVSNCYSTGSVTGRWTIGGLVGWNHQGTVTNSYSTGSVTGEGSVGGLVGQHHDGTVSNSHYDYDEVLINGRNTITIGALSNEDFEQWLANNKSLEVNERLSKKDGYYLISDVSDFKELLAFGQDSSLKFRLTNDLDLGSDYNFFIPYLAGEFDGDDHKIRNLGFHSDFVTQVGLFGYLASGGAVTGVSAENVNIFANGIVGGLVAENDGAVSNSYATGRVGGWWSVGGLVGWIGWNGGTVSNSYYNYNEVLINNDQRIITIGALSNQDFDQWLTNDKVLDVNERLSQEDGYYLINNVGDFKQLLAFGQDSSLKFRLTNDLNLGSDYNFFIPYLAGEFDGNGHKISNLRLNLSFVAQAGLFGYLAYSGKVSEVGVENINLVVTASQQAGGLVGGSSGIVTKSYSTGSVTADGNAGGLLAWNSGSVSNSYSTGSVAGNWGVGGLVGWNYWNPDKSGTVSNSYSTGSVTGTLRVGGLLGQDGGTVQNSFWDVETSGQATSERGVGKTTAEMQNISTFSGVWWVICGVDDPSTRNTAYIWNIVDGQTYPFLSWEL